MQAADETRAEKSGASPGRRSRSLFSFGAFHFLDDGFTDSLYILLPFIASEFHLSFSQVGFLKGFFSASMSALQLPLSFLGERLGEVTVIGAGLLGLTGGFLVLSAAYSFPGVFLSLILAKGSSAGQHGLGSSVLSRVFEQSGRRAAMGTYNFSGDLGKVSIPFLLAVMINLWGWRQAVGVLAVGGLAAAALLWAVAGKRQPSLPPPSFPAQGEQKNAAGWGIRDRKEFSALLAIGIIDIAARNALLTFIPFLLIQKEIPVSQVGFALTLLFAGGAAGKFACGFLAEWFGVIPMVVATEGLTALGIFSLYWIGPAVIWFVLPLLGVVLNGTSSVLYATVAEIISPAKRSRGYGLYYAITLGSGAVSPMVYGLVTDSRGLSFTLLAAGSMVLVTLPLCRYLLPAGKKDGGMGS